MDNSTQCSTPATSQLCLRSCNSHNQHPYSAPHDHAGILEEDDRHTLISGSSTFTFSEVPIPSGEPTISQEYFHENDRVEMISPAILERSVNSQCFDPSYYIYVLCVYMCIYVYVATYFQHDRNFRKALTGKTFTKLSNLMLWLCLERQLMATIIDRTNKAICLPLNLIVFTTQCSIINFHLCFLSFFLSPFPSFSPPPPPRSFAILFSPPVLSHSNCTRVSLPLQPSSPLSPVRGIGQNPNMTSTTPFPSC